MSVDLRDSALAYAARGWPVFPLKPAAKTPLTNHGLRDASTLTRQIEVWWAHWPAANIGVDCGRAGLVVIDVDPDNGGIITWSALDAGVPTLTSRSGGGGCHVIYAQPQAGKTVCSSAGRLGPGVDVRGAGGYIVLPPSLHESGRRYKWLDRGGKRGSPPTVAPVPVVLLARLRAARGMPQRTSQSQTSLHRVGDVDAYVEAALRGEVERVRFAPEGTRNDSLNRAAFALGQLAGAGMLDEGPVASALVEAALAAGLDEPEARRTFGNGFYAGLREPRMIPVRGSCRATTIQPPAPLPMHSSRRWARPTFEHSGVSQPR